MTEADALIACLEAERAAIYAYGVVGPRMSRGWSSRKAEDAADALDRAEARRRELRDTLADHLRAADREPPPPAPGYVLPADPEDADAAAELIEQVENDNAAIWRDALARAAPADRRIALEGLSASAVLSARWRRVLGEIPGTSAFPGR